MSGPVVYTAVRGEERSPEIDRYIDDCRYRKRGPRHVFLLVVG